MSSSILIIDDDSDDRDLFREALFTVDSSIDCIESENAEDAFAKLTGNPIKPALIFLDINLPGMSGWQCLKELKQTTELRDIPVIMYSTSDHPKDTEIAVSLGALCLIPKPMSYKLLVTLQHKIVSLIRSGSIHSIRNSLYKP